MPTRNERLDTGSGYDNPRGGQVVSEQQLLAHISRVNYNPSENYYEENQGARLGAVLALGYFPPPGADGAEGRRSGAGDWCAAAV